MRISDWSSDVCSSDLLQLRVAHLPVDRGAPVAAVALAGAVVEVEHEVAVLHQKVVEHLLAEVVGVARADVLQVAGAVDEHHHRVLAARLKLFGPVVLAPDGAGAVLRGHLHVLGFRSEEHTSELQSLMRTSYADFCLQKKIQY